MDRVLAPLRMTIELVSRLGEKRRGTQEGPAVKLGVRRNHLANVTYGRIWPNVILLANAAVLLGGSEVVLPTSATSSRALSGGM